MSLIFFRNKHYSCAYILLPFRLISQQRMFTLTFFLIPKWINLLDPCYFEYLVYELILLDLMALSCQVKCLFTIPNDIFSL